MGIKQSNNSDLLREDMGLVERIMKYEDGLMDWEEVVNFFQELLDTGFIMNLQGHYQRTAQTLIEAGQISYKGNTH
tara:strand:+ start:103 stop:330 length:228 start_codon:yes stop_codon:yes gene_type:complete